MRLKIMLLPEKRFFSLPINYQYQMSSSVYRIFQRGSESVAEWLHNSGFQDDKGRKLKLFNFSYLNFNRYELEGKRIIGSGETYFLFSAPIETNLVKIFVSGVLKEPQFELFFNENSVKFLISSIEVQDNHIQDNIINYKTIAPVSVSIQKIEDGKKKIKYLAPSENIFASQIEKNLLKKYKLIKGKEYSEKINISVQENTAKSKLISIKEGKNGNIKVKGYMCKLKIEASPEMQKIAYYCGIGEKNSLGFGMIERINKN
jgi:CRISPR-associated endoribonuclease Cas6